MNFKTCIMCLEQETFLTYTRTVNKNKTPCTYPVHHFYLHENKNKIFYMSKALYLHPNVHVNRGFEYLENGRL